MFFISLMPEFITACNIPPAISKKYGYNFSMLLHGLHGYYFKWLVNNPLYTYRKYLLQVLLIIIVGMSPNYWHAGIDSFYLITAPQWVYNCMCNQPLQHWHFIHFYYPYLTLILGTGSRLAKLITFTSTAVFCSHISPPDETINLSNIYRVINRPGVAGAVL